LAPELGWRFAAGAVLDGTEIAALVVSRSSHLLKVGDRNFISQHFLSSSLQRSSWELNRRFIRY
jgi:hypothetical protein